MHHQALDVSVLSRGSECKAKELSWWKQVMYEKACNTLVAAVADFEARMAVGHTIKSCISNNIKLVTPGCFSVYLHRCGHDDVQYKNA